MANRTRSIVLRVPVTAEERALIEKKMQQMGTRCFSVYARKMLIDGYVIKIDYSDIKAMTAKLQKIGTNINQIARRVNATGTIYAQDIEFEKTRLRAMNKGNNLAHHLIQAFEPGEVTPEAAHEIGRQLADSILGGKYEYVLTTHIDKGHVHNHLIFCAVDFAEHKKYISNRKSYGFIRRTSDRLCKENGLSVVIPGADRGKHYAEWDAQRKGTSYKQKLKIAIDRLIPVSADLDDLLRGSGGDIQIINPAMKRYVVSKERDIHKLLQYAQQLRVQPKVQRYLEILL